ncbi:histone acetyltransferase p300-like [Salarias fasciatus]|uniref:histone acetyltransferase p300-like n=1 Tax=Salarias fasciatus TaxID=181472 RepID=UPI0011769C67|nr:histone acetyltransferase p300-like [Salarias fasciatus]
MDGTNQGTQQSPAGVGGPAGAPVGGAAGMVSGAQVGLVGPGTQVSAAFAVAGEPPTSDPGKRKLIQQQLVLLLHAHKCQRREQANGQCSVPHCRPMKNVLNHMTHCQAGRSCQVAHCASSRQIISHWKNCTRHDCPVCLPLKIAERDQQYEGLYLSSLYLTRTLLGVAGAGLGSSLGAVPGGQQSAPNINPPNQIDPSTVERAYAALGLTNQGNQPQAPQPNMVNQGLSGQAGMRPLNPMGVNASGVNGGVGAPPQSQHLNVNSQGLMNDAGGVGSMPTAAPPSATSMRKSWHEEITQDLRNHLVHKLVQAIFPTPDPAALSDRRMENVVDYARKVEGDMYESANSRVEYYHLLAEKIYKIQKEMEEKRRTRLQKQGLGPGPAGIGQPPTGLPPSVNAMGVNGGVGAPPQSQQASVLQDTMMHLNVNSQGLMTDAGGVGSMPTAAPPSATSMRKSWHEEITQDLRNHLVHKIVQAIFPTPDPAALRDRRMENLVAYARKVEGDMYESADSRAEYHHFIAEKVFKIQKELEEKRRTRLQKRGRGPGPAGIDGPLPGPSTARPTGPQASLLQDTMMDPNVNSQGLIHVAEVVHGKLAVSKTVVINFSEAEATVEGIATKVREALGSEEGFILTDSQGREILDSEDTRSSQYWKQNSGKVFALPESEFRDFQNGQRAKRSRRAEASDLQDVVQHIDGLKRTSDSISQPSEMAEKKVTEANVKPVKEAFTCLVCLDVMVEPTFSKCCCSLLGCGACVREWLLTSDHCLKCRSPNFKRNIHSVKGLDAALAFMK